MKPLFPFFLTLALLCSFASTPATTEIAASETAYVYICTGGSSTKYHKTSSCRGLNNCQGDIVKITKSDAENKYRRTACKRQVYTVPQ